MEMVICGECGYPHSPLGICGNPACRKGTNATPANVAKWDAERVAHARKAYDRAWLERVRRESQCSSS